MSQTNSQSTQAEECGVSKISAEKQAWKDHLANKPVAQEQAWLDFHEVYEVEPTEIAHKEKFGGDRVRTWVEFAESQKGTGSVAELQNLYCKKIHNIWGVA